MRARESGTEGRRHPASRMKSLPVLVLLAVSTLGSIVIVDASASSAKLAQCANGGVGDVPSPCLQGVVGGVSYAGWINGNTNGAKAHWQEGQFVPYRVIVSSIAPGTHYLVVSYDTVHSGGHAIDYLGSVNGTETFSSTRGALNFNDDNPCLDVLPANECSSTRPGQDGASSPSSSIAAPSENLGAAATGGERGCGGSSGSYKGVEIPGKILLWGPSGSSIISTEIVSDNVPSGSGTCTSSFKVTFSLGGGSTASVVLAWGGHIASEANWGSGNGAASISGSPYHMNLVSLDGASTGSQDRALSSSAIFFATGISTQIYSSSTNSPLPGSPPTVHVGDSVYDVANFSPGSVSPTAGGTVTYTLYRDLSLGACSGTVVSTSTVSVSDPLLPDVPPSPATTIAVAGDYGYVAAYSGDAQDSSARGACEPLVVGKASTTITTLVSPPSVIIGSIARDTATLSGGSGSPSGTITFTVYGAMASCLSRTGELLTSTKEVNGLGSYTSDPFNASAVGTYFWLASYGGDIDNSPSVTSCGDSGEVLTVTPASPSVTGLVSPGSIALGEKATDTGTVSGGLAPTGTLTFDVYTSCNAGSGSGTPVVVGTAVVGGDGSYVSPAFKPTAVGTYYWVITYGGDGRNNGYATVCGAPGETLTVGPPPALITPVLQVSPSLIDQGQSVNETGAVTWSGGVPDYQVTLFSGTSPDCQSDTQVVAVLTGTNPEGGIARTAVSFTFASPVSTTYYCARVTDSAPVPQSATSLPAKVTVDPALVPPVIAVSPSAVDLGGSSQLSTLKSFQGGAPGFLCQWLVKGPADATFSSLGTAFACAQGDLPSASTNSLAGDGVWTFELSVTDSSGSPNTAFSNSVTVTVNPPMSPPVISASPGLVDLGQGSSLVTTTSFNGGTSPFTCQWLEKGPSSSGYGPLGGPLSCTPGDKPLSPTGALDAVGEWTFELQVTDRFGFNVVSNSAAVEVNSAISPPTITASPQQVDEGQNTTLSTTTSFAGGTPAYQCQWLAMGPSASSFDPIGGMFSCTPGDLPTTTTGPLSTVGNWSFILQVSDSASPGETVTSNVAVVRVMPQLTPPTIAANPTTVFEGQTSNLSTVQTFGGGTSPFTCRWLEQVPGGNLTGLGISFACNEGSLPSTGSGVLGLLGTYTYVLVVNDSRGESASSGPATVTVLPPPTITVACKPSTFLIGLRTVCRATVAGWSPTGQVVWSSSNGGNFHGKSCNLVLSSCSVRFAGSVLGAGNVTANYLGDSRNPPLTGSAAVNVIPRPTRTMMTCRPTGADGPDEFKCQVKVLGYHPSGSVTYSSPSGIPVTFTGASCPVNVKKGTFTCTVLIVCRVSGYFTVMASYSGDSINGASSSRLIRLKAVVGPQG